MPSHEMMLPRRSFMARHFSKGSADKALAKLKEHTEQMTGHLVQTAEVAAGGGAAGYITRKYSALDTNPASRTHGKMIPPELLGVPVDLLVGVGLNVVAHAGLAGKSATHLYNVGDGFLAWYVGCLMSGAAAASEPATAPGVPPVA